MGKITEGRYIFDFGNIPVDKADIPTYNGLGGVDFIIELKDRYMFIEVKDLENKNVPPENRAEWIRRLTIRNDNPFLTDLGVKFKDTIIRNWAKNIEFNKPIWFIVILQLYKLDARQKAKLSEDLSGKLPTCILERKGFKKNIIIKRREVISIEDWKNKYPEFPIQEII
ncbi:MAG: hypothetical protein HQK79_15230 [Desulfobacterales bacterium]|nr:hypothetical protein [Desulfobacterales bacterium]